MTIWWLWTIPRGVCWRGGAAGRVRFHEAIKAREHHAGRYATDSALLVAFWLYGCTRGVGSAHELARRCQETATFRWLCGVAAVNHRLLSKFRTGHPKALDALFTQVIAALVDKAVVTVGRIGQDGVRVRMRVGAASFRREELPNTLLAEAKEHVKQLREQADSPAQQAPGTRQRAAERSQKRLEEAIAQLPEIKKRQAPAAERAGGMQCERIRARQQLVSATDPAARVMKMPNGGFNPAVNVRLAANRGRELEPKSGDRSGCWPRSVAWRARRAS